MWKPRRRPGAGHFKAAPGNRLELFTNGDDAFEAANEAIQGAKERVWLETYIFEPDEVGNMARDALAEAAQRGCSVILLFDRWGSPKIGMRYAQPIIDAGGRVAVYNPVLPWRKLGRKIAPVLHRDHRKILVADDTAFCGGANVSLDYGGPGPEFFFDLTLRVEGPCVQDLAATFLATLRSATGNAPPVPRRSDPIEGGAVAQVLTLNLRQRHNDLDLALENSLELAQERCLLMTPYFVPPDWFKDGLVNASEGGVDVQILTAGRSDVPLARVAGRHLYEELLEAGIRVFEMQHPVLHAKCITIDGRYSIVGSYNVDAYGGKHNLEVGLASSDPNLASHLEAEFHRRTADSEEVILAEWKQRPWRARVAEAALHALFRV